jgi:hypothetical protein
MPTAQVADKSTRTPDRVAASLAIGFVVLLLATELILSLPDETASASDVATFYAAHRNFIIILQVLGFGASALLGGYAWRLRRVDRVVSTAGMILAVSSLVPGLVTMVIAIVADPDEPALASRWNLLEPRGDDILFVGILLFAAAIALRLGRRLPALGVLALLVAVGCLTRLVLEMVGTSAGPLAAAVPLSFLILVAVMAVSSFLGVIHMVAGRDQTSVRRS